MVSTRTTRNKHVILVLKFADNGVEVFSEDLIWRYIVCIQELREVGMNKKAIIQRFEHQKLCSVSGKKLSTIVRPILNVINDIILYATKL